MLKIKTIINFYFYLGSKWLTTDKGDVMGGSSFFFFPIIMLSFDLGFLLERYLYVKIPFLIYLILSAILVIPIYKYYKKDNRGDFIIDKYENSKYNKWYMLMFFALLYFIVFESITFGFIYVIS